MQSFMNICIILIVVVIQWRIQGGWGGAVPPFLEFTSKKVVLNEYEIFLKMLEMALIETQIFKTFLGSIPQDPSM